MKNFFLSFITFCLIMFFPLTVLSQSKVSLSTLFDEMVNLDRLTSLQEEHYKSIQFSSYDRRSTSPNDEGWFVNSDGFGYEPIPGFERVLKEPDESGVGEYLICDVQKPGAILRLWSAGLNGNIRVYVDNIESPLFEGKAEDFFWKTPEVLMGEKLTENLFRQFDAVYFPVPFSKRLRIEWIGDIKKVHFYHVGLRVYNDNVQVEAFSKEALMKYTENLESIIERMAQEESRVEQETQITKSTVPSLGTKILWETEGTRAIESFCIRTDAPDIENTLRKSILSIYFDNSPTPQVEAPLGDFFGAAPGINPYNSIPFSVGEDGTMVSQFIMPFKQNARIEVKNYSEKEINLYYSIKTKDCQWEEGETMHFRTRWRMRHEVTASNITISDYPYLMAIGQGRIVGAATYIYNPSNVPTSNGNWWGEGDEKIFVDGETFPSFFGTGSEDYYNYSWSSPRIFSYPYCGQPRNDGPGNRGYVSNFRWHILDDIPFNKMIAFYMELFHHGVVPRFSYGSIVYYYALPGTLDDYQPISMDDLKELSYYVWSPESYRGSRGYLFFNAEDIVEQTQSAIIEDGKFWADGKILMWKPEKRDDQLKFIINNDESKNETHIGFTMAKMAEGGEVSVSVNGTQVKIGGKEILSLKQDFHTVLDNYFTDTVQLKKGRNEITLNYESENPGKKIGIDFVWIRGT